MKIPTYPAEEEEADVDLPHRLEGKNTCKGGKREPHADLAGQEILYVFLIRRWKKGEDVHKPGQRRTREKVNRRHVSNGQVRMP